MLLRRARDRRRGTRRAGRQQLPLLPGARQAAACPVIVWSLHSAPGRFPHVRRVRGSTR